MEAEAAPSRTPVRAKTIRLGEGRAIAILSSLRDSGGKMAQLEFEETCLRNCRTLVGAGGFIARGSIERHTVASGDVEYRLTEKGMETVAKWESRYGTGWTDSLENSSVLGNPDIDDNQKARLLPKM